MRLIDADELVKAIENENPGLSISGAVEKFARIAQVNMQPTVDAIPVKWIEKYNRVRGWEVTVTTQNAIDNMLNAWEKENDSK